MAYVTDAAREYAKKLAKDAKHTFEDIETFLGAATPPWMDEPDLERFEKNGKEYIRIATNDDELIFTIDYDSDSDIANALISDATRKNRVTNKIIKLSNMSLDKAYRLLVKDDTKKDLRKTIKRLIVDRDRALMTMHKAYHDFMNKWQDEFENICRMHHLGYPGAYNNYLIDLQDLDDTLDGDMKPLTEEEINEQVEELLDNYE